MKIKKEITRGLGAVSACLLTVVSIGTPVAEAYEGRLNTVLGIETTKTVSDEGLDVDTDYYKSDYWRQDFDWHATSIRAILNNPVYLGQTTFGRTKVKGLYSEKKDKTYDADVVLIDSNDKYVHFRLDFDGK